MDFESVTALFYLNRREEVTRVKKKSLIGPMRGG